VVAASRTAETERVMPAAAVAAGDWKAAGTPMLQSASRETREAPQIAQQPPSLHQQLASATAGGAAGCDD